jgi:hypothetical protein
MNKNTVNFFIVIFKSWNPLLSYKIFNFFKQSSFKLSVIDSIIQNLKNITNRILELI